MLAELILNVFGELLARRNRILRWAVWLFLLAIVARIIYAGMAGPVS